MAPTTFVARTDEQVAKDVFEELRSDPLIDGDRVEVTVSDGSVVLKGAVPTYEALNEALTDAWAVEGVVDVESRLTVERREDEKWLADTELEENAMRLLELNPAVDASNLDVEAMDSELTLSGTVPTHWQKQRAEQLLGSLQGVVDIRNELVVTPAQTVKDEAIAENITAALERNFMIDAEKVDVTVESGVVTLSGSVPTRLARDAAVRAAGRTPGVSEVKDELAIQPMKPV